MKKSLQFLTILMVIATTMYNTTHSLPPADQKKQAQNDAQAMVLTKTIQNKRELAQNASTPGEQQRIADELKNDIEQATTYLENIQNFFGYGPLAEKKRMQAKHQKNALEQKLFLEKKHFKTLHTDADKEKSLKKQSKLINQIHTEKIALGQEWSLQQKALAAALASATAYAGYQYGGQAVSAAKKWLGEGVAKKSGEPTDTEMMAAYQSFMPTTSQETIAPTEITPETPSILPLVNNEPNYKYDFTNTESPKGVGQWLSDQAYYLYNLLPSLRSTATTE